MNISCHTDAGKKTKKNGEAGMGRLIQWAFVTKCECGANCFSSGKRVLSEVKLIGAKRMAANKNKNKNRIIENERGWECVVSDVISIVKDLLPFHTH